MERVIATFWREMKEKNNHGGGDRSFIGVKTAWCTFKKGFRKKEKKGEGADLWENNENRFSGK